MGVNIIVISEDPWREVEEVTCDICGRVIDTGEEYCLRDMPFETVKVCCLNSDCKHRMIEEKYDELLRHYKSDIEEELEEWIGEYRS